MDYSVKKVTIEDYDAIYELWSATEQSRKALNPVDDSREGIARYLKRNPDTCFAAVKDNRIIGVILTLAYIFRYAEKVKADPTVGINYENNDWTEEHFGMEQESKEMTGRDKLILFLFFITFVIMVYGVAKLDWWFGEMAALFLVSGIIMGIIGGLNERKISEVFIGGASDLVSVALVCGLARAVNMLLTDGKVSDTLLYIMSGLDSE